MKEFDEEDFLTKEDEEQILQARKEAQEGSLYSFQETFEEVGV